MEPLWLLLTVPSNPFGVALLIGSYTNQFMAFSTLEMADILALKLSEVEALVDKRLKELVTRLPASTSYLIPLDGIDWTEFCAIWPRYYAAGWVNASRTEDKKFCRFTHNIELSKIKSVVVEKKETVNELMDEKRSIKV